MAMVKCPTCRKVFKGSTLKSARSSRDRHVRETHQGSRASAKCVARKRRMDAQAAVRRRARATTETRIPVAALVLCPLRRADHAVGHYYAATAEQLMGAGVHEVQRIQGYDLTSPTRRAESCTSSQVVMKAFEDIFLARAAAVLDSDPALKHVLFVEDDMSFQQGIGPQELRAALGDARSSAAVWLGSCDTNFQTKERLARPLQNFANLYTKKAWEPRAPGA